MIWLGSFPKSGNTFLQNLLLDVYGVESSTFDEISNTAENYRTYPFVKTHMRPKELIPHDDSIKGIYILRDGRDALIAMARQREKIDEPTSNFRENFIEALVAAEESYFGGWSIHSTEWIERADLIIRLEDLLINPAAQIDRLNNSFLLSEKGAKSFLPFDLSKLTDLEYNDSTGSCNPKNNKQRLAAELLLKHYQSTWRNDLDQSLQNLYWSYHRSAMERMGYNIDGTISHLNPDFDYKLMQGLGQPLPSQKKTYKVLIEANKLLMHQNDGVKRYLLELLKALYPVSKNKNGRWKIDLYLKGRIYPLSDYGSTLFDVSKSENSYNKYTKIFKAFKKVIKIVIPKKNQETFSKYSKKVLMKIGLKFAKNVATFFYIIERFRSGKEVAKEIYESQIAGVEIGKYDLIHVPLPQHYEPFLDNTTNFLVTIHDLTHRLFPEYHTNNNIDVAERGFQFFETKHTNYICISDSTRTDVLTHSKIKENQIYTVYEAADNQKFRPNTNDNKGLYARSLYGIPEKPFLFTLSTLEPRKNLLNTIKAFDLLLDELPDLNVNLVIGGKNGWKSKELMKLRHQKNVIFTGFIDENDLPLLYNEAEGLCYISYYEGFGLPPLEAMSCKTPVIYGNNSSMKEFFEGYGLPANPDDIISIKEQMKLLLTSKTTREELEEKSLKRSFDFSWRKTAIETINVYEDVILKNQKK